MTKAKRSRISTPAGIAGIIMGIIGIPSGFLFGLFMGIFVFVGACFFIGMGIKILANGGEWIGACPHCGKKLAITDAITCPRCKQRVVRKLDYCLRIEELNEL